MLGKVYKAFNPWDDIDSPKKLLDLFARAGLPWADCQAATGEHPIRRPEDWWTIVMGSGYRGTIDQLSQKVAESVRDPKQVGGFSWKTPVTASPSVPSGAAFLGSPRNPRHHVIPAGS